MFATFRLHTNHTYDFIVATVKFHRAYTGRNASHLADFAFVESYGTSVAVCKEDFRIAVGEFNANEFVAFAESDCFLTFDVNACIFAEASFLDNTLLCCKYEVVT